MNADLGGSAGDNAGSGGASPHGRRPNGVLEAEILAVLQEAPGPLTAGQVMERLGGGLAYTTVVTTLSRLHDKRVLSRVPAGRAFAYAPVTDAPGLIARRMHKVLEDGPDRRQVLTRFVSELPTGDAELLRALLGLGAGPETDAQGTPYRPAREE